MKLIEKNKLKVKQEKLERDQQGLRISKRKVLLETEESIWVLKLIKTTRQKVLDNIVKPVHKDKDGKLIDIITEIFKRESQRFRILPFSLFYELTGWV